MWTISISHANMMISYGSAVLKLKVLCVKRWQMDKNNKSRASAKRCHDDALSVFKRSVSRWKTSPQASEDPAACSTECMQRHEPVLRCTHFLSSVHQIFLSSTPDIFPRWVQSAGSVEFCHCFMTINGDLSSFCDFFEDYFASLRCSNWSLHCHFCWQIRLLSRFFSS